MLFINISNHPMSKWGEDQDRAVEALGTTDLMEIPFPNINPNTSTEEIRDMAEDFLVEILYNLNKRDLKSLETGVNPPVAHIMGEMTFTHTLVSLLKERGFICVASCSERVVQEVQQEDGTTKKVSIFKFVQFREY